MNNFKERFGNVRKAAIFIHYSIYDIDKIEAIKEKLEKFCKEELKCDNYEIFIEIGSFEKERPVFEDLLNKCGKGEFSHCLVTNIGQIYKLTYDLQKAIDLTDKIQKMNVTIISVDEKRIIYGVEEIMKREKEKIKSEKIRIGKLNKKKYMEE